MGGKCLVTDLRGKGDVPIMMMMVTTAMEWFTRAVDSVGANTCYDDYCVRWWGNAMFINSAVVALAIPFLHDCFLHDRLVLAWRSMLRYYVAPNYSRVLQQN